MLGTDIDASIINDPHVQKALYYHTQVLQAEVDLDFDMASSTFSTKTLPNQDPNPKAVDDVSQSTFKWDQAKFASHLALYTTELLAIPETMTLSAETTVRQYLRGLNAIHLKKLATLSGLTVSSVPWPAQGDISATTLAQVNINDNPTGLGPVYAWYGPRAAEFLASTSIVPVNALDANGKFLSV